MVIKNVRKHKRLDVELDLHWTIEGQDLSGSGKLLDVSAPGACFRMQQPFTAKMNLVFRLHAPAIPAMPRRARLRWYRKLPGKSPVFLCGVIFENADNSAWHEWLDQALDSPPEGSGVPLA